MFDFKGRVVVVTGGTRGIGRAIALAFIRAGARVCATYVTNDAAAEAFRASLGDDGDLLANHRVDVSDYQQVEAFYRALEGEGLKPDVLVNNAGNRRDGLFAMMSPDAWSSVLNTHLNGTYNMSKFAVKVMIRKRSGRIITITSPVGKYGFAGQVNYAAAKAGQVGMTRALAKEVAPRGITVNCVSPGFIDTEFIADLTEAQKEAYLAQVPMKRFGTPEEVAACVMFLASEQASYVTGATLEMTGGL